MTEKHKKILNVKKNYVNKKNFMKFVTENCNRLIFVTLNVIEHII